MLIISVALFLTGCGRPPAAEPSAEAGTPAAEQPADTTPQAGAPAAGGPSSPAATPETAVEPAAPPEPATVTLGAGTVLSVRTTSTLSTKTAGPGDVFEGSLAVAVRDGDRVVLPRGTPVRGRVVSSDPGGRVKGVAHIAVSLTGLSADGGTVRIATNTISRTAKRTRKKDAAKVGIGAGIGAIVGAIAGGGKGAAIGAAAGGGAGGGAVLATRGDPAVIPAETVLRFSLTQAVTVPVAK